MWSHDLPPQKNRRLQAALVHRNLNVSSPETKKHPEKWIKTRLLHASKRYWVVNERIQESLLEWNKPLDKLEVYPLYLKIFIRMNPSTFMNFCGPLWIRMAGNIVSPKKSTSFFHCSHYKGHYITKPNNALLQGTSVKITVHLHCLIPNMGNSMIPTAKTRINSLWVGVLLILEPELSQTTSFVDQVFSVTCVLFLVRAEACFVL